MEISKARLKKITPYLWEIPQGLRQDMRVPVRIYVTEKMLDDVFNDKTITQLANVATLPGIVGAALAMPDAHEGYGFPIGGVAAIKLPDGVISPGGIGYDINCGVRLLRSQLSLPEVQQKLEVLLQRIYQTVPSGVGEGGELKLSSIELDAILRHGVAWMVKHGYANDSDMRYIESNGALDTANPDKVSEQAKKRGYDQLGTLGSGNHFIEIDVVEDVYDETVANAFGLWKNQVVILIHTGSRGLGHQVATDYIKIMQGAMKRYGIILSDRELACVPFSSPEGADYFAAMAAAANFAWANRQMITYLVRQAWAKEFGGAGPLPLVYDVAHNIAKIETHVIDGKKQKVIMHRKGATRAFGPGNPELPVEYRHVGQPVLIPGSMGTASYVLVGTEAAMLQSLGSSCHGAGRRMSRAAAKRSIHGKQLKENLLSAGIYVQAGSYAELAEEAPSAYKHVDDVVNVVDGAGIARKVVKLKPKAVIKG